LVYNRKNYILHNKQNPRPYIERLDIWTETKKTQLLEYLIAGGDLLNYNLLRQEIKSIYQKTKTYIDKKTSQKKSAQLSQVVSYPKDELHTDGGINDTINKLSATIIENDKILQSVIAEINKIEIAIQKRKQRNLRITGGQYQKRKLLQNQLQAISKKYL
jgi:hypothetical protein